MTGQIYSWIIPDLLNELILSAHQTILQNRMFLNLFYKASIILIPKQDKDATKKKTVDKFHWCTLRKKVLNKIHTNQSKNT
jgi:hypothetical protein